jgi:Icc-related predicted phosphoesterase
MKRRISSFEVCPAVCAAGDHYIICIPTPVPVLMSVFIAGEEFTNDFCGVKISSTHVQKFSVPQALLNHAKKYTVVYEIIYREAYSSKKEAPVRADFSFQPIEKSDNVNIYHLSDVHGGKAPAIAAAQYFGNALDLLILNGDISSSSQTVEEMLLPLQIAFAVTKGEKPCIITRGNHDLRGLQAERIGDFYPLDNGLFYYTVQLGPIHILVLDCGEDKNDDHREYAGTIAFHKYRKTETAFIQSLIAVLDKERHSRHKYRFVLSHIPFMHTDYDPQKGVHEFDIEQDIYGEWVRLLNEEWKPDFGLFGHVHRIGLLHGAGKFNEKGFTAPIIFGGKPLDNDVLGCAIVLKDSSAEISFNGKDRIPLQKSKILF